MDFPGERNFALLCPPSPPLVAHAGPLSCLTVFYAGFSGVRRAVYAVVRLMFGAAGFHRVRTVGEQATRQQAPVLVVAPHSSFYDGLAAVVAGGPTIVAKEENSFIPVVGSTRLALHVVVAFFLTIYHDYGYIGYTTPW